MAEHGFLTMTGLYNVLERVRGLDSGADVAPLSEKEQGIYEAGLVGVLKEIHDDIDRAVLAAYGWGDLEDTLVGKPGATTPSEHKSADQEAAEEELLSRLVALNRKRAEEEHRGNIRWLRPEFQALRLSGKAPKPAKGEQIEADMPLAAVASKQPWPKDGLEQIRIVRELLEQADGPVTPETVAASFAKRNTPKRKQRVAKVLETLAATGSARTGISAGTGKTVYFLPR